MGGQGIYSFGSIDLWTKDQESGCTLKLERDEKIKAEIDITAENHQGGDYQLSKLLAFAVQSIIQEDGVGEKIYRKWLDLVAESDSDVKEAYHK